MENNNNFYGNGNYHVPPKKKLPVPIIIAIAIISLIVLIAGGLFISKKMEISSLTKEAETYSDMEEYESAIKAYTKLYRKTGKHEYKLTISKLKLKQEIKDTLDDAKKQEQNDNPVKAIVIYKMVPQEDEKNYKFAQNQIDSLKSEIMRKASSLSDAGSISQATTLLSEYLAVVPDDKKAVDLYKKLSGKNDAQVKEVVVNKTVPVYVNNGGSANRTANDITGTYQYITSSQANARSGPSKSASVIGTLYRGDSVYVYSTYVESESRIWCKTDYGWISYNTMNNTIR